MGSYHSSLPGEISQKWMSSQSLNITSTLLSMKRPENRRKRRTLSFFFTTILRQCAASNPLLLRFVIHILQPLLLSGLLLFFNILLHNPYGFIVVGIGLFGVLLYSFYHPSEMTVISPAVPSKQNPSHASLMTQTTISPVPIEHDTSHFNSSDSESDLDFPLDSSFDDIELQKNQDSLDFHSHHLQLMITLNNSLLLILPIGIILIQIKNASIQLH